MSDDEKRTEVKLYELLVRIITLKNNVIELGKKILLLISKVATDAEIVDLMKCFVKINTECKSEEMLEQSEVSVEKLEKDVKKLAQNKPIQNDVNFGERKTNNGKKHTGPRYNTTTLLGRIMKLEKKVIGLIRKILELKNKITDVEFAKLVKRFVNIDTECDSEEMLEQSEDRVEELEEEVDRLERRSNKPIQNAENSNTIKSGKEHKGPKP